MLKDEKRDERICQSFLLLHAVILITWWDSCLLSPLPPLLMSLLLLSSAIRKWRFRPCQKDSNLRTKSWQRAAAHHAMRRERVFMSKGFFFAWRGAFRVYKSKYYFLFWRRGKRLPVVILSAKNCAQCWKNTNDVSLELSRQEIALLQFFKYLNCKRLWYWILIFGQAKNQTSLFSLVSVK